MAVIQAFHVEPLTQQTDNFRVPPELFDIAVPEPKLAEETWLSSAAAVLLVGLPGSTIPGLVITAVKPSSFEADYYHRVHLLPNPLEFGAITAGQRREFEVWNAYEVSNELTDIQGLETEGLTIIPPGGINPPTTYLPLESRIYEMQVESSGAPEIDAQFLFTFDQGSVTLYVTGTKLLVWPFPPDFNSNVEETLEWLTDVLRGDDSTEQCIRLREDPRRSFSYLVTAAAADQKRLQTLLWSWQANVYLLPMFTDYGKLTDSVPVGSITVPVNTQYKDFSEGGRAVIFLSTTRYEALEVQSVSAGSLTLSRATEQAWPKNSPIFPARSARLEDKQPLSKKTNFLDSLQVKFSLQETSSVIPAEFSVTEYLGYPVLEEEPNWRDDRTAEYSRDLQVFDNMTGVIAVDDLSLRPTTSQAFLWSKFSPEAIYRFRQWLYARAGRLFRIWTTSGQKDMLPVVDLLGIESTLTISNIGYTKYIGAVIGRRDICIRLKNGTKMYRRIVSSVEHSEDTESLFVDTAFGADIQVNQIVAISWMQLTRLSSDSVNLSWKSTQVMECTTNLLGVNDDI